MTSVNPKEAASAAEHRLRELDEQIATEARGEAQVSEALAAAYGNGSSPQERARLSAKRDAIALRRTSLERDRNLARAVARDLRRAATEAELHQQSTDLGQRLAEASRVVDLAIRELVKVWR